jgi:hypothetical protein
LVRQAKAWQTQRVQIGWAQGHGRQIALHPGIDITTRGPVLSPTDEPPRQDADDQQQKQQTPSRHRQAFRRGEVQMSRQ